MDNPLFGAAARVSPVADDTAAPAKDKLADSARLPAPSFASESAVNEVLSEERETSRHLSTIGRTLVFKGQLNAAEDLLIQGRVEGSIEHSGSHLTIGANGTVKADISAHRVIIQGTMHGEIRATESITIEPSAKVRGNLYAPSIGLKEGAKFKGSIDMDGKPSDKSASKPNRPDMGRKSKNDSSKSGQGDDETLGSKTVDELLD